MRLKIQEILYTQIEYEIERAVLIGLLLDKPQRFSCAPLGLPLIDRTSDTVQHGGGEGDDRACAHASPRPPVARVSVATICRLEQSTISAMGAAGSDERTWLRPAALAT